MGRKLEDNIEPSVDESIFSAVIEERQNQVIKWGVQRHTIPEWLTILGEEYGEACKAGLDTHFDGPMTELRKELVQVMAVTLAIIEGIDST